ncbi:protein of unknown function [Oenococcus oeni]|uniref:Uncharacterized protein n=1 Tax=Oenococcus oeni TaxID=1247 RepID=A0AAQ2UTQ6_OENOE|nr:hypothetical protein OENI_500013 [Oenococcus oeni]VDB98050.1 protein of unknown function [Oenococcus oeni]
MLKMIIHKNNTNREVTNDIVKTLSYCGQYVHISKYLVKNYNPLHEKTPTQRAGACVMT